MNHRTIRRTGLGWGWLAAGLLAARAGAAVTETVEDLGARALPESQQHGTARALAMDSAWVAVADGAPALQWNAAGLGKLAAAEVGLHHTTGLGDATGETVIGGVPLGAAGGAAASLDFTDHGRFERRDATGDVTGSYGAGSLGGNAGWGIGLPMGLAAGGALKVLEQTLDTARAVYYAADVGVLWNPAPVPGLTLGASYANLGLTKASWTVAGGGRVGGAYGLDLGTVDHLLVAAAAEVQAGGLNRVNLGAEDVVLSLLALRAGYLLNLKDQGLGGLTGVTAGLGLQYRGLALDYAYVPYGDLGTAHRVSLTYRFIPTAATGGAQ